MTGTGRGRFAGALTLVGLGLRRDRIRVPVWIGVLVGLMVLRVANVIDLHPTQASLDEFARIAADSPAAAAINGTPVALDTMGGRVAFEVFVTFATVLGLLSVLLVTRHARAEEQEGRTELVRSRPVGRLAQPVAAVALGTTPTLAVAALTAGVFLAFGLPPAGSALLAAAAAATGAVFAAVAALASQLAPRSRQANGLAVGTLAGAFALRAVGDTTVGWASWLSPLGWALATEPFGSQRWWPVLLSLAAAALILVVALVVADRRDVGQAVLTTGTGPATAAPGLASPLGMAIRLHRGATLGWLAGIAAYAALFGVTASEVDDVIESNPTMADALPAGDGAPLDAYLAVVALMLAILTAGYVVQGLSRLRAEEVEGRAELLLARPVDRLTWAGAHVAVVAVGSAAVLAVAGIAAGLLHGARSGRLAWTGEMMGATLAQLPAVWTVAGVALVVFGLVPRATPAPWLVLAATTVIAVLGEPLGLPGVVNDLSPFAHVPDLPGAPLAATGLIALSGLTVLSAGLAAVGLLGFRRRDLQP